MPSELKPCPFCGARGHKRTSEIDEYTKNEPIKKTGVVLLRRSVECRNPTCSIRPSTWLHVNTLKWDVAIKAWNTRPPQIKDSNQEVFDAINEEERIPSQIKRELDEDNSK